MKILHVCNSLDTPGGGVTHSVGQLLSALHEAGADVRLLAHEGVDKAYEGRFPAVYASGRQLTPYKFTPGFADAIEANAPDIVHVHGTWLHIDHAAAVYARRRRRPLVVSPRGMLYPEAFAHRHMAKWMAWLLAFRKDLLCADCVHATCEAEAECLRNLGFRGRIAVIPDPVEDYTHDFNEISPEGPLRLVYLGRLDSRKGIDLLIKSLPLLKTNAALTIAGDGPPGFVRFLKSIAGNNVQFAGQLDETEKTRLLDNSEILVMPSDFENFGRVAAEALLSKTPIIVSCRSPWHWVEDVGCGLVLPPCRDAETLARSIDRLATDRPALAVMGGRGRREALRRFAPAAVANKMKAVYDSIC